jgi:hypothetical protein
MLESALQSFAAHLSPECRLTGAQHHEIRVEMQVVNVIESQEAVAGDQERELQRYSLRVRAR